jgi:phage tail-like protein
MALPGGKGRVPLMAYGFRVVVGATTVGFKEVSGLVRAHATLTYRDGLSYVAGEQIVKYYDNKFVPITLKKAVLTREALLLYAWLETHIEVPMSVSLCDERGLAVVSWRIARALPVKLTPATFDAGSGEVSIDTLEVMAAGITLELIPESPR